MLLPKLEGIVSRIPHNHYWEPFVGSGVLGFSLPTRKKHFSDINEDLINFYRIFKRSPRDLYEVARKIPASKRNYYTTRKKFTSSNLDSLHRAAYFFYLNRFCFNGIYRTNLQGEFNVPFGTKTGGVPELKGFLEFSSRLKNVFIACRDFEDSCNRAKKNDLVYLDPPYDYSLRRDRGEYGKGVFNKDDLDRLGECLNALDEKGVKFVCSYVDVADVESIASRWNVVTVSVKRQVAAFSSKRKVISELIVSNQKIR